MTGPARPAPFWVEPLDRKQHDRAAFRCGMEALDLYLQRQAGQDVEKRVSAVFVLTSNGRTVAGFYTLSQYSVNLDGLPREVARKLPRYPELPATLLGRLALATSFHGQGLGELLLFDALQRALKHSRTIASIAVVVDLKNPETKNFYTQYGFFELPENDNKLFLPMDTIERLFEG